MARRKRRSKSARRRAQAKTGTRPGSVPACAGASPVTPVVTDAPPPMRAVARDAGWCVVDRRFRPALASWLLGATAAMMLVGVFGRLAPVLNDPPLTAGAVLAGALFAMALGVRMPQQVTVWICRSVWMRVTRQGRASPLADVLLSSEPVDRPLNWNVLAALALLAGISAAFLPVCAGGVESLWRTAAASFVWSTIPASGVYVLLSLVVGLVPFATIGLGLSCVHHLACAQGRWGPTAGGWFLVGGATGLACATWGLRWTGRADMVLVASSLPCLAGSLAAISSVGSSAAGNGSDLSASDGLPVSSDHWPTLLRASVVAVVVGGAMILGRSIAEIGVVSGGAERLALHLLLFGTGQLIGVYSGRGSVRSIGGFGMACAVGGLVAGGSWSLLGASSGAGPASWLAPGFGLLAIGFVFSYGLQVVLHRVSGRSGAGGRVLARCLAVGALAVWMGVPVVAALGGAAVLMAAVALGLIAIGGTLIIHEPGYSPRRRRLRLSAIFGAVLMMVLLARL